MRVKALALTSMLVLGLAGPAMAETQDQYDPAGGGSAAPNSGGEATASSQGSTETAPSGGAEYGATTGSQTSAPEYPVVDGFVAKMLPDGTAAAPAMAPAEVQHAIWAANELIGKPYVYGGGHNPTFKSKGYDCSGTVSYALHGANLLKSPLDSGSFMRWGGKGKGSWMTIWTNQGHAFMIVAGLRLDTSSAGDPSGLRGPRWRPVARTTRGFVARHPVGF
ncbi:MAG: NlpC/P60 family protein [Solirubrobacterales bacterium]|nr:NlpC/P60 family protein [Solirubrobacterales bacterium]